MKTAKRIMAFFLCFLMLRSDAVTTITQATVSSNDAMVQTTDSADTVKVCEECGSSGTHAETCSFNTINTLTTETTTEGTQTTTEPTTTPTEADEVTGCTECGQTEGYLESCSQYVIPANEVTEPDGPQVGDKIWIKSGSMVYKEYTNTASDNHELMGNYEVKITEVIADESGNAIWYKFEFTSLGVGEVALSIGGYKYVLVENTSEEELEETESTEENVCNCGENAPENLADHADSCPRKQYVKSLFENKSAEEIYAQWDNYDEELRADLLNMLQKWDSTKYEELKKLVDDTAEGEKETTVGDISLKLQGVPEDVTLSAQTVTTKSYSEEVFEAVGSHKVIFAIDITLSDEDGEWQPAEGQNVTVSLDAASLDLSEGERIGILHDHDGSLNDLGICTVTDGKLTFTTDGFSVFYGYTVDFEYDGTWHSISGGSYIYLSELFEMLDIDRSVNNVTDVVCSDDTLLKVSHLTYIKEEGGGQDWRLISLEPFDTEELLTVTFSDGEELLINVYDKNWGTDDINTNENWNNGDEHGNRNVKGTCVVTITQGATIKLNGSININKGAQLTIQCEGDAIILRNNETETLPMFRVNGGTLIIKSTGGTITIDGNNKKVNRAAFVVGYDTKDSDVASTLELTNVRINNCYSKDDGYAGAIHQLTGTEAICKITIDKCMIYNCRAPHGSAIYFRGDSRGQATITDTIIQDCVAYGKTTLDGDDQGGIVRSNGNNGSVVVMERCILKNNRSGYSDLNTARSDARCYGGAIYWNAAGTTASGYGDTINSNNKRAKFYIYDCQILDNKTTNRGGGIFNEQAMYIGTRYSGITTERVSSTVDIKGTLIDGNYAGGYTGDKGINCGGGVMIPSYGGGAAASKDMDVSLDVGNGVFITNNSSVHGGGLAMQINQTDDKNNGVTFSINYDGATIQNNTATENGGGIYITMSYNGYKSDLNLISGEISDNEAKNGGGIYVENTNINIGTSATTADNPISIINNTASANGGGIYLKQEKSYANTVLINVANGFVTGNTATQNGGGIYQTGSIGKCVVSGAGKVSNNNAANGGGIYIAGGSELTVSGGIISGNYAKDENNITVDKNFTGQTAQGRLAGVGGGIYVMSGSFSMSGESKSVGIYGNIADFAADDAYASGVETTLTVPDVNNMKLEGNYAFAEGWFVDYVSNDTNYAKNSTVPFTFDNNGRYRTTGNTDNPAGEIKGGHYYCLTLGRIPSLVITKVIDSSTAPDNDFLFRVTGPNAMDIIVTIPANEFALNESNKMEASVVITKLATGEYTVTELTDWSWRYQYVSSYAVTDENEKPVEKGVQFTLTSSGEKAVFTNTREENKWLSSECYAENWWGGDNGTKVTKRKESN